MITSKFGAIIYKLEQRGRKNPKFLTWQTWLRSFLTMEHVKSSLSTMDIFKLIFWHITSPFQDCLWEFHMHTFFFFWLLFWEVVRSVGRFLHTFFILTDLIKQISQTQAIHFTAIAHFRQPLMVLSISGVWGIMI